MCKMSRRYDVRIKQEPEEPDESMETIEYERIIEFAKQVQAGVHPRVKVPEHMAEAARADPSTIDFAHDYYIDIGLHSPLLTQDSILRGYKSKWDLYNPLSRSAEIKWASKDPKIVKKVMSNWERVQKAYKILSDPALRALYDGGRLYSLAVRSKQKSKGKGKARMKFAKRSTRNFVKGKDGYHQRHRIELKREEMDA